MALNVTPFVGTDNFNMETFNNMISQINSGVNSEISDVLAQLGTKAKIQTGSYVGTGTHGESNPNTLTFDFVPKIVAIFGYSDYSGFMSLAVINTDMPDIGYAQYRSAYFYGGQTDGQDSGLMQKIGTAKSLNGKTLSWYGPTLYFQCNISGNTYYYYALA